jgi:hypothetical protein
MRGLQSTSAVPVTVTPRSNHTKKTSNANQNNAASFGISSEEARKGLGLSEYDGRGTGGSLTGHEVARLEKRYDDTFTLYDLAKSQA